MRKSLFGFYFKYFSTEILALGPLKNGYTIFQFVIVKMSRISEKREFKG